MSKKPFDYCYPEAEFGGFSDVDGTIAFYMRLSALINLKMSVVDFGCGRGAHVEDTVVFRKNLQSLRGRVRSVIGVDVDEAGGLNPTIDEFRRLNPDGGWPVESASVDLVFSDGVMEHLTDPEQYFSEAARILRKGGYLCLRTSNAWGYVALAARILPKSFHGRVLKVAQPTRREEDSFPTLYRCNSICKLRRQMSGHGFDGVAYGYDAEPSYLSFSAVAYRIGVWSHKVLPGCLRSSIFVFCRKRC